MTNIILTAMLLTLPLFLLQKNITHSGLNAGLWISLFFWGRLHYSLSILVFICALLDYRITLPSAYKPKARRYNSVHLCPALIFFLSLMIIYCALGSVVKSYGSFLQLDPTLLTVAENSGFVSSLAGPVLFGILNDKRGPFPAVTILLLIAAVSMGIVAQSSLYPFLFPIGHSLFWITVSGTFVLLPLFAYQFLGPIRLYQSAPGLILLLSGIWSVTGIGAESSSGKNTGTLLIFAICLILTAALFSFLSWKSRLSLVQ